MRYFSYLLLFAFCSSMSVFSQEKITKHTVSKGETISEIADKYNIKPSAIYALNPKAKKGIKFKTVLLIPTESRKKQPAHPVIATKNSEESTHEVLSKETLYGIAKQYNVSVEDLYAINPNLEKEGLKQGEKINVPSNESANLPLVSTSKKELPKSNIPEKGNAKKEVVVLTKTIEKVEIPTEGIIHEVLSKETLYSIAKQYGIKLSDLQNANSTIGTIGLKVGQKIMVPVKGNPNPNSNLAAVVKPIQSEKSPSDNEPKKAIIIPAQPIVENNLLETEIQHEVLPKESLYSIAKQYKITVTDLQKANSTLEANSLKVGQKINVPVAAANSLNRSVKEEAPITEIFPTDSKQTKQSAILPKRAIENNKVGAETIHEVLAKETKYGIAKEYGITVKELEEQNPKIVKELLVGYKLKIRSAKLIETLAATQDGNAKETILEVDPDKMITTSEHDATLVDKLIQRASENIGTRYRPGGTTKEGFDCSGLMCSTFGAYDIQLPRSSIEMASYGVKINPEEAQKGDLIFFKTRGGRRINHVGMVVEVVDGDIKFIHSSTGGGVIISSIKEKYYDKNFVQINHVL